MVGKNNIFLYDFLSFFLILSAPFLHYLYHIDFLFELSNLFVIAGFATISAILTIGLWLNPSPFLKAAIPAILVLLFMDFQFAWFDGRVKIVAAAIIALLIASWIMRRHISLILVVVFGTIIAGTIGTAILNHLLDDTSEKRLTTPHRKADLPVYLHIILDEQIGIEGLDDKVPSQKALKNQIKNFFSKRSFRVYGRAYSQYFDTRDSIASSLNLIPTSSPDSFYSRKSFLHSHTLLKSAYFEKVLSEGYGINIYQSTYMDFCNSIKRGVGKCITYNSSGPSSTALRSLNSVEKINVILSSYGELSAIVRGTKKFYRNKRNYFSRNNNSPPDLTDTSGRIGPISTLPVFDKLIKDISSSQGGTMFFAHLLIPHFPYSVDSACQIRRPVMKWASRHSPPPGPANSPQSRLARYEEYIPQVQCALSKIKNLFDVMETNGTFENAIIIIHGDHGSRIAQVEPRTKNKARLSPQDFYDGFSTLYVEKSPKISPGYDKRMMALPKLLSNSVSGQPTTLVTSNVIDKPFVFLRDRKVTLLDMLKVPMPEIPIK
jgi:hypothetical protein